MFDGLLGAFGRSRRHPLGLPLPTGSYEIPGVSCNIRVRAEHYPKQCPMHVRVMWKDRLKFRAELAWQRDAEYGASIFFEDIDGVTPRDLLLDIATVWVEDPYGRSARLKLDGASQLSLVRQHLDRDREILQSIDFTASGNARRFGLSGFSGAEAGLTWTDGPDASLAFPCKVASGQRYELSMHCWPFLPPAAASQSLTVDLNGHLKILFVDRNSPAFLSVKYEGGDFSPSDEVRVRFAISNPGRPCDQSDSKDGRLLGFAFKHMSFSRLLSI